MELRDYVAALRRYWITWVVLTLAGVAAALAVVVVTPAEYRATAQVFVASTGDGTSGSQFVNQRVTSYPDVARSRAVLGPVIDDLGLQESFAELRARVSAVNPADTSQIDIAVTGGDAAEAAEVANAVAEEFGIAVEDLEQPSGGRSPVDLTVTNPATTPTSPDSPATGLLLPLGLVAGLALGAAAAIGRSQLDTTLYTADDLREAWGDAEGSVPVLARPAGRAARSPLVGRPATMLARRIELLAEEGPVRLVMLSPSPADALEPWMFVDEVAAELRSMGLPTTVAGRAAPSGAGNAGDEARVLISVGSPQVPLRTWRRISTNQDAVVLVVAPGHVERAEFEAVRSIVAAAGIRPLALVLYPSGRRRRAVAAKAAPDVDLPVARSASGASRPVPATR
jgi:capsular polysaccharide biosynthesis protein